MIISRFVRSRRAQMFLSDVPQMFLWTISGQVYELRSSGLSRGFDEHAPNPVDPEGLLVALLLFDEAPVSPLIARRLLSASVCEAPGDEGIQ